MSLNNNRTAVLLWGIGLIAVITLSLLPPDTHVPLDNFATDKVRHFTCYAILALLACRAGATWRQRLILCIITFFTGVLIEFLQPLTGRDFESLDMFANFFGVSTGILASYLYLRWRNRPSRPGSS